MIIKNLLFLFMLGMLFKHVLTAQLNNEYKLISVPSDNEYGTDAQKNFYVGEDKQIFMSSNRNINEFQIVNLIIVTQVDGTLSGLNRQTGEVVWSINTEPVISASSSGMENSLANSQEFWAVEPYGDGALYFFTKESGLSRVPLSVKDLVLASPFSVDNDDKVFTGTRKTSMVYVNVKTGELVETLTKCCSNNVTKNVCLDDCSNYLTIGKVHYELLINSKSDNRAWNISYTKLGENNLNNDLKLQNLNSKSIDGALVFPFQQKSLLSIDINSNIPKWVASLNSTCINVFDVYTDLNIQQSKEDLSKFLLISHPIKPSQSEEQNQDYGTYLGQVPNDSWFAMSSENYPSLVKSSAIADFYTSKDPNQDFVNSVVGVHKRPLHGKSVSTTILSNKNKPTHRKSPSLVPNRHKRHASSLPDRKILSIDPPMEERTRSYSVFKFILRLMENSVFTVVMLLILYYASKAGFIPPLTTIMYKLGFMKRTHYAVEFAERILADTETKAFNGNESKSFNKTKPSESKIINEPVRSQPVLDLQDIKSNSGRSISHTVTNSNADEDNSDDELLSDEDQSAKLEVLDDGKHGHSTVGPDDIAIIKKVRINDEANFEDNETTVGKDDDTLGNDDILSKDDSSIPGIEEATFKEENDESVQTTKTKKRKRGSRGGKNKKKGAKQTLPANSISANQLNSNLEEQINDIELVVKQNNRNDLGKSRLVISDDILGYGSHGTVVYKGTFENRPVAVKRMLIDFYDVASHEVTLLQESDDHPNVIRYFCSRQSDRFLYIALELCSANLEDLIDTKPLSEVPDESSLIQDFKYKIVKEDLLFKNYKDILYQMTSGLHHLHKLNIVHRDIKPQNILVTPSKTKDLRVLISDFGLCKKLEPDQSSFRGTTASGTSGWRAPELLTEGNNSRVSKGVDVFSLGLVFYYVLSKGRHPYGDKYNRESNILQNRFSLDHMASSEAKDLISKMLEFNPKKRLTTDMVLKHPFFWNNEKKIEFLLKVSDKLNILPRDSITILKFEKTLSVKVFDKDWKLRFDPLFFANINTFRKYDSSKLLDLLRVIRNKYHHINEIPEEFHITEENFYQYFSGLFPELLISLYYFIGKNLKTEFESFYS